MYLALLFCYYCYQKFIIFKNISVHWCTQLNIAKFMVMLSFIKL